MITWKSRVTTCDNLTGRVSFVWKKPPAVYFRVSFPLPSPYFDDWAVYRQHELRLATAHEIDPAAVKSIVDSMRPKLPATN